VAKEQPVTDSPLKDRTIVVTGAARGLGAALAHELARRGARLALLGHEGPRLHALAASLPTAALAIEVDVTDNTAPDASAGRRWSWRTRASPKEALSRHRTPPHGAASST
jgi:NAD(P)-dependent dehydrogenase (short-subunit alcohol dehydrogenase family)